MLIIIIDQLLLLTVNSPLWVSDWSILQISLCVAMNIETQSEVHTEPARTFPQTKASLTCGSLFKPLTPPNRSPGYKNWDCKEPGRAETRLLPHTHYTLNTQQTHLRTGEHALQHSEGFCPRHTWTHLRIQQKVAPTQWADVLFPCLHGRVLCLNMSINKTCWFMSRDV